MTLPLPAAPVPNSDSHAFLATKIDALQRMILYCAQSQKFELGSDIIQKYAALRTQFNDPQQAATPAFLADVIGLYDQLSRLIAPVTPTSIAVAHDFESDGLRDPVSRLIRVQIGILLGALVLVVLNPLLANFRLETGKVVVAGFEPWVWQDIFQSFFYFMIGVLASSIYSMRLLYARVRDRTLYITDAYYYIVRNLIGGVMAFAFVSYFRPFLGDESVLPSLAQAPVNPTDPVAAGAIAFLAGYGVEVIYTALDSMVLRLRDLLASLPKLPGLPASVKVSLPQGQAPASTDDGTGRTSQS